jgi:hypothetical protein
VAFRFDDDAEAASDYVWPICWSGPPQAPTEIIARMDDTGVTVTWRDNSHNEDGFRVYRSVDDEEAVVVAEVGRELQQYRDARPQPGQCVSYDVVAFNAAGESIPDLDEFPEVDEGDDTWFEEDEDFESSPTEPEDELSNTVCRPLDPVVPTLVRPRHDQRGVSITPTLNWAGDEDTEEYEIEVWYYPNPPAFPGERHRVFRRLTSDSEVQPSLGYGRNYYWRVRARNEAGWSAWSALFHFSTLVTN